MVHEIGENPAQDSVFVITIDAGNNLIFGPSTILLPNDVRRNYDRELFKISDSTFAIGSRFFEIQDNGELRHLSVPEEVRDYDIIASIGPDTLLMKEDYGYRWLYLINLEEIIPLEGEAPTFDHYRRQFFRSVDYVVGCSSGLNGEPADPETTNIGICELAQLDGSIIKTFPDHNFVYSREQNGDACNFETVAKISESEFLLIYSWQEFMMGDLYAKVGFIRNGTIGYSDSLLLATASGGVTNVSLAQLSENKFVLLYTPGHLVQPAFARVLEVSSDGNINISEPTRYTPTSTEYGNYAVPLTSLKISNLLFYR